MFNRSRQILVAGLSLAIGALGSAAFKAQRADNYADRRAIRGKPITSRFFWGGRRWRVPLGGGAREVARRRRQIQYGTLMTTEGHERLRALRQGRPFFIGFDLGSPDGDVTALRHHDGTVEVLKHTAIGKSEVGPIVLVDADRP